MALVEAKSTKTRTWCLLRPCGTSRDRESGCWSQIAPIPSEELSEVDEVGKRRVYSMHLFDQGVRKVGAIKLWIDKYEDCGLIEKIRDKSSQHFGTPQKIDQVRKVVNEKPRLSQRRGRLGQNERRFKWSWNQIWGSIHIRFRWHNPWTRRTVRSGIFLRLKWWEGSPVSTRSSSATRPVSTLTV